MSSPPSSALLAAGLWLLLVATAAAAAPPLYMRGAAGWEASEDATLRDRDCASQTPPALFGCGPGSDGEPMAARGGLGDGELWEVALGAELGPQWRLELALGRRGLDLAAEANFRGVSAPQPVRSAGRSTTALLVATLDLGSPALRVRPFVAAGAGAARNEIDAVVYAFPTLAPGAVTVVQGGDHTDLAWMAAAGAAVRLSPRLHLDLGLRYTDLGELRTDAGPATIVRSRGTFELAIDGTRADLATAGVALSLRYRLGAAGGS